MTNHQKKQTREAGGENSKDKQPADDPHRRTGSPMPDTAAPILQSEDDELSDEDAPK
ncbi:hypothetical protein LMG28614_04181 [Paraburkholderia ultramafica]|uniref:Uncharacterized protein n=1 Tax=Paraburkholderia ultramafica TaxID=1544867 RepID=A0A6S7BVD5_9BURK|nr:hypothetical protein [Paraburkholderia ultramafica]CAB3795467.1 hypothetical protein LMG28614_04181 [Paraburkholderia ultramafica]